MYKFGLQDLHDIRSEYISEDFVAAEDVPLSTRKDREIVNNDISLFQMNEHP